MNNNSDNILIVEDDNQIKKFICYSLKQSGFNYFTSSTGNGALMIIASEKIDILILDLGLPDMDGTEIIKNIRQWSDMPIIVISARDQDRNKVEVLDMGADDYLTKPFSATELMARIRVALRHLNSQDENKTQISSSVGKLRIDYIKHLVFLDDNEMHITPMEYKLLVLFFKNIGKVITTQSIIKELWGAGYGNDTQALRALMAGLRRKIEINPAIPRYIKTEIGVGYRLVDE